MSKTKASRIAKLIIVTAEREYSVESSHIHLRPGANLKFRFCHVIKSRAAEFMRPKDKSAIEGKIYRVHIFARVAFGKFRERRFQSHEDDEKRLTVI